jgi:hypothetical protein
MDRDGADKIERFVVEHNVSRFFDRLDGERDADRRAILSQILLSEENKYAALAGNLTELEIYISRCDLHIAKFEALADGADTPAIQSSLRNFVQNMKSVRATLQFAHAARSKRLGELDRP